MDFRIDANLPATAAQLWAIFFDLPRVAGLIPGCENVTEVVPLKQFSAVLKQKIGPFKLEVPTNIAIESYELERFVEISASGKDKFTGTTIEVRMKVDLFEEGAEHQPQCRLSVDAQMQVAGRLAALGYPVVKKRSDELFAEFEQRLRNELAGVSSGVETPPASIGNAETTARLSSVAGAAPTPIPRAARAQSVNSMPASVSKPPPVQESGVFRRIELVLVWPRVGATVGVGVLVAQVATTLGQSPWWWLAAPLLGVAAGLGERRT